eukprot:jgi/Botrbrau1/9139/Bobra.160_3s0012.3
MLLGRLLERRACGGTQEFTTCGVAQSIASGLLSSKCRLTVSLRSREKAGHRIRRTRGGCVFALRNIDEPEALLFDCDGVLVDTEADGHRVSFNAAFKEKGLDHAWDVPLYGKLLEIGGGKERMTKYFLDHEDTEPFKSIVDPAERKQYVADLHKLKTDIFMQMIESGSMPLRPGVKRLVGEAIGAGVPVAVCSTSNERAVSTIVKVLLGGDVAKKMRVFAGDIVPRKKPDPAIYLLAAQELNVNPARFINRRSCLVVQHTLWYSHTYTTDAITHEDLHY